jgi:hypothetical protein
MKKFIIAFLFAALTAGYAFPRQRAAAPNLNIRKMVMEDSVINFYVTRFQKQAEVSDETFGKIIPFLRQFVTDRFAITNRRQRALNQLRQMVQGGAASEDELKRAVHDFDAADAEFQANQEKFLANVDPLLNPRQQARLRLFQVQADNQMRTMLDNVQQANRQNAQRANQPN